MPKGTVTCDSCNWEIDGELPTPGKLNYASHRGNGPDGLDTTLAEEIKSHHYDTANTKALIGNIGGHRHFKAFIEGAKGEIEANSYTVVLRYGKEK